MADSSLFNAVRASILAQRNTPPIERVDRRQLLPASFAQQRLWFMEQLDKANAQHNLCVAFQITGNLNTAALQDSLSAMVQRHESLRTSFKWNADQLWQVVSPPSTSAIVMQQDNAATEADVERIAKHEASQTFDIEHPPLLRCRLIGIDEQHHVLLLTFHHLAFDGWSFEIFMRELGVLYGAFSTGLPSPLSELSVQYADFAVWQRKWLQGQVLQDLQAYWLEKMTNPPAPLMISSIPKNPSARGRGNCLAFRFGAELNAEYKGIAQREGLTDFMFLLTAFNILLFRLSGESDIIVGVPIANRNRKELEGLIGLLVNTLPIRSHIRADMSVRELMAQVRQTVLEAYTHQDFLFEMLIEALRLPRRIDRPPLVQTMFSYLNVPKTEWTLADLKTHSWNVHNGCSRFDLNLTVWETDGALGGELEYDCELFDLPAIESLVEQWRTLLSGIIAAPDERIDALPLLTAAQTQQILSLATGAKPDYPRDTPIHRVFETIVKQYAEKTALNYGAISLSYTELNNQANQLACFMTQRGVTRGGLVVVCLPASPDFIIAILAILKLGAAFLPVELTEPVGRIESALRGAGVAAVISHTELSGTVLSLSPTIFMLDKLADELSLYPVENLVVTVDATDLAYVMFTSGSTGEPKAVCIPHRGVVRLACAANYAQLTADEVMMQLAPLAFDASTFEIWGALLNGARLVIPVEKRPSLSDCARLIAQHNVSTLWLSSGLFAVMMDAKPDALANLHQLLVGGDVLSRTHTQRYLALNPNGRLINCYGPTENTTFSSFHVVTATDVDSAIPIGRPLNHGAVYVLDDTLKPVPFGVTGEAWVAGDGLMSGYLNNPEANANSLYKNPFSNAADELMYRTGDSVKMYANGELAFIARKDRQLKIRGYRVEPDEIETLLMNDTRVAKACVIASKSVHTQLIAYLVIASGHEDSEQQLIADLRLLLQAKLPEPLRPTSIVFLPELPLDNNGKVNYAALGGELKPLTSNDPPQDAMEQKIADLFGELLQVSTVGRHDAFFEVGGHSLLALLLLARLEEQFAVKLPVASLFEQGTPALMAAYIRACDTPPNTQVTNVVELRRGSTQPSLFMVAGGRGGMAEMILYTRVMRHLARDMAVFGLLADDKQPLPNSVREMAATYITRLKLLQPQGPYLIAGECVGGVIAYEMAQQLDRNGDKVNLLLLDSWCPKTLRQFQYLWRDKVPRYWEKWNNAQKYFFTALIRQIHERPTDHWRRTLQHFYCIIKMQIRIAQSWYDHIALMRRHEALGDNYIWQAMRYRPARCPIPINLVVSEQNNQLGLANAWQNLADNGLQTWVVAGTHETYLRETPKVCAQVLNTCLDQLLNDTDEHHESTQAAALDAAAFEKLRKIAPNILANKHAARNGSWQVQTVPEEIAFKLTNRCDLRCSHCYQWNDDGYHRQLSGKDMDLAIIAKVLAATRERKSNVYLWGGEPLLYRDWDGLVKLLSEDKRWTSVCTNGTFIEKRLDDLLSLSSQLEVSISLDGFEQEHDAVRGQGAFAKTLHGLHLLVAQKRMGTYQGEITVNFLITNPMVQQINAFVAWLEEEGVDTLYVSLPWFLSQQANERMDDYYQQHFGDPQLFQKPSWYSYNYPLSTALIPELAQQLTQLKQRQGRLKLRYNPELTVDELATFISGSHQAAQNKTRCQSILTRMDIFPDGQVVSCKFFPEFRMGDLNDNNVANVWLGERFSQQRQTIAHCGLMPVCAKCNLLYTRGG